jgi:hypothetical protein
MAVKKALPSRCLQSTVLSASDFIISLFHTAPFPFMEGHVRIRFSVVRKPLPSKSISSWQSGLLVVKFSWFLSKEATISFYRFSHKVGSVISPA